MSSLYDLFKEIYEDNSKWDYYEVFTHNKPDFEELFTNPDEAKSFILNYIKNGAKDYSPTLNLEYTSILSKERAIHTVSIFFLGVYLYNLDDNNIINKSINIKIKNRVYSVNNKPDKDRIIKVTFAYFWFLICFYHDMVFEIESTPPLISDLFNTILTNNLNLSEPIYKDSVPNLYKDIWKNYLYFRLSCGKIDHGIFGGFLFYNDMEKKYNEAQKNGKQENGFITYKDLTWSKEILEEVHGYVAWIIIAHNIWYIDKNDRNYSAYKKYNLKKLINVKKRKIGIDNHPLLLLLCLVDTIDPIKCFKEISPKEVLANIELSLHKNEIVILFKKKLLENCNKICDNINSMMKWLRIDCLKIENYKNSKNLRCHIKLGSSKIRNRRYEND